MCVYLCECACVCLSIGVYRYIHTIPQVLSNLFLRQGLPLAWDLTRRLDSALSSSCLHLLHTGVTSIRHKCFHYFILFLSVGSMLELTSSCLGCKRCRTKLTPQADFHVSSWLSRRSLLSHPLILLI